MAADFSSKTLGTFLASIGAGLFLRGLTTLQPPVASAQDGSERAGLTSTSLQKSSGSTDPSRESRLQSIEEELLKKLNMDDPSVSEKGVSEKTAPTSSQSLRVVSKKESQGTDAKSATVPLKRSESLVVPTGAETTKSESPRRPSSVASRQPRRVVHAPIDSKPVRLRYAHSQRERMQGAPDAKDLEYRLAIAESQVALLSKEVESTKSALMSSEARVAELSKLLTKQDSSLAPQVAGSDTVEGDTYAFNGPGGVTSTSPSPAVPNARVVKSRSVLRTGPSMRESSIARLERDSIVTIERRDGSWYRIISPDGTRGWISGASLIFDEGNFLGSTVNVIGYQPRREPTGVRY